MSKGLRGFFVSWEFGLAASILSLAIFINLYLEPQLSGITSALIAAGTILMACAMLLSLREMQEQRKPILVVCEKLVPKQADCPWDCLHYLIAKNVGFGPATNIEIDPGHVLKALNKPILPIPALGKDGEERIDDKLNLQDSGQMIITVKCKELPPTYWNLIWRTDLVNGHKFTIENLSGLGAKNEEKK